MVDGIGWQRAVALDDVATKGAEVHCPIFSGCHGGCVPTRYHAGSWR
jgi:hypothetical protein